MLGIALISLLPPMQRTGNRLWRSFDAPFRPWMLLILLTLLYLIGSRFGQQALIFGVSYVGVVSLLICQILLLLLLQSYLQPIGRMPSRAITDEEADPASANRSGRFGSAFSFVAAVIVFFLLAGADTLIHESRYALALVSPLLSGDGPLQALSPLFSVTTLTCAAFLLVAWPLSQLKATPTISNRNSIPVMLTVVVTCAAGYILAQPPSVLPLLNAPQLRIATYNMNNGFDIDHQYNLQGIVQTIRESGSQVVLLQEVHNGRLITGGSDQSLLLARRLSMARHFYGPRGQEPGLAVLTQVPIVFGDGRTIDASEATNHLQRVQLQPDASTLVVYNTYLSPLIARNDMTRQETLQQRQLQQVFALIDEDIQIDYGNQAGRLLLGGSFFNVPGSPTIRLLEQTAFTDPFAGSNVIQTATVIQGSQGDRLDYLWLWPQGLQALGVGVVENDASDHRLAFAGVQIRR